MEDPTLIDTVYVAGLGRIPCSQLITWDKGIRFNEECYTTAREHPLWKDTDCLITFIARLYVEKKMTSSEVAAIFGKSKAFIIQLCDRTKIPKHQQGRINHGKLTAADVRAIRAQPEKSSTILARELGVSRDIINQVKVGKTYSWVSAQEVLTTITKETDQ